MSGKQSDNLYNQRDRFFTKAQAASSSNSPDDLFEMMDSGFALADAHCNSFFSQMEILQRDSAIGRDMVAPIITTLTGLIALRNFSGGTTNEYLEILTLGSNVALAGIDTVDKHFLFDSDNIREVRGLTFKALGASEEALRARGTSSFNVAFRQLTHHQTICSPASILDLTKRAIRAGEVTANSRPSSRADEAVLADLAAELGIPGALTQEQAGALWHLYKSGRTPNQLPSAIKEELAILGDAPLVTAGQDGTITLSQTGTTKASRILAILNRFSPATASSFAAVTRSLNSLAEADRAFVLVPSGQSDRVELEVN